MKSAEKSASAQKYAMQLSGKQKQNRQKQKQNIKTIGGKKINFSLFQQNVEG